jgi:hypothetical protein
MPLTPRRASGRSHSWSQAAAVTRKRGESCLDRYFKFGPALLSLPRCPPPLNFGHGPAQRQTVESRGLEGHKSGGSVRAVFELGTSRQHRPRRVTQECQVMVPVLLCQLNFAS